MLQQKTCLQGRWRVRRKPEDISSTTGKGQKWAFMNSWLPDLLLDWSSCCQVYISLLMMISGFYILERWAFHFFKSAVINCGNIRISNKKVLPCISPRILVKLKKKKAWKLLKLLFWKYCQTQLKNLQKSALNGIDSFSLLTFLSLDLSGHLCHPNAALRCMKTNFICITIKHNSGHNNVE